MSLSNSKGWVGSLPGRSLLFWCSSWSLVMGHMFVSGGIIPWMTYLPNRDSLLYCSWLFSGSTVKLVACALLEWIWLCLSSTTSMLLGSLIVSHFSPMDWRTWVSPPGECGLSPALTMAKHLLFSLACLRCWISFCLFFLSLFMLLC